MPEKISPSSRYKKNNNNSNTNKNKNNNIREGGTGFCTAYITGAEISGFNDSLLQNQNFEMKNNSSTKKIGVSKNVGDNSTRNKRGSGRERKANGKYLEILS